MCRSSNLRGTSAAAWTGALACPGRKSPWRPFTSHSLAAGAMTRPTVPTAARRGVRPRRPPFCGRPAHQIRQRQACGARLGVPLGASNGASGPHGAPFPFAGVRGGTAPRQPLRGTREVWPRGVCWLPGLSGVRQARPRRVCKPTPTAVRCGGGATPRALRGTRSPGLAKRGRRRDGGPRCRAVHGPAKPDRRLIPANAPVGGRGHQSRRGIDQPELRVSSRVSPRWVVLPLHPSVTPKGDTLRT